MAECRGGKGLPSRERFSPEARMGPIRAARICTHPAAPCPTWRLQRAGGVFSKTGQGQTLTHYLSVGPGSTPAQHQSYGGQGKKR